MNPFSAPACLEYANVEACTNCPRFYNCPFEESEQYEKPKTRARRRELARLKNQRDWDLVLYQNALVGNIEHDFDENDQYVPVGNHIKYRSRSGDRRFLKRQSARLIRRTFDMPKQFHKTYDYWNHLY